MGLQIVGDYKV